MIFDVRTLALKKSRETGHSEKQWLQALESARMSLKWISTNHMSLEQLALSSQTPEQFTLMIRLIYQAGQTHPQASPVTEQLLSSVSDSAFSLRDWIEALEQFTHWLNQNQEVIDLRAMLKYLLCCTESAEAKTTNSTLSQLLESALEHLGYEGE
ncbi:MAG: hypothetical protein ACO3A2_08120 [Bdellovibrionia bacterium]